MNWESSIKIYTLSCVKQITSGKLQYNTGSPAQHFVMTWGGGRGAWVRWQGERLTREWVCIHIMGTQVLQWCLTLCDPMAHCPWDFPGKNTGVGCQFLLQATFPTHKPTSPASPVLKVHSLLLSHWGSLYIYIYIYLSWLIWVVAWQKPAQHCKAIILQLKKIKSDNVECWKKKNTHCLDSLAANLSC